jgi:hypothetical protein
MGATGSSCHKKTMDPNNSAYVDGFFTFLSSKAMHAHGFCHGIDYYGMYLAHKHNFEVSIMDDLEFFHKCGFFKANNGVLYDMDPDSAQAYEENLKYMYGAAYNSKTSGRAYKPKLEFCSAASASNHDCGNADNDKLLEILSQTKEV